MNGDEIQGLDAHLEKPYQDEYKSKIESFRDGEEICGGENEDEEYDPREEFENEDFD
jgi:hypothetical protein